MKALFRWAGGILTVALFLSIQNLASGQKSAGNRAFHPYRFTFQRSWEVSFQESVRLIEIGPVTSNNKMNLVLLLGGSTPTDTRRVIRVMHWLEPRFVLDTEVTGQALGLDTLLLGRFHSGKLPTAAVLPEAIDTTKPQTKPDAVEPTPTDKKDDKKNSKSKPKPPPKVNPNKGLQVMTTMGLYAWNQNSLLRLASVPPDVKIAIAQSGRLDSFLVGAGNGTTPYEFLENEVRPITQSLPSEDGYARSGVGTQSFQGSENLKLPGDLRYVQSAWNGRIRWLIALQRGTPAPTASDPDATSGDRLVVFVPRISARDKNFWTTRFEDMEEVWRSEPLPGKVLDVRVGDPKNEGKPGIVALISEKDGRESRILFFGIATAG